MMTTKISLVAVLFALYTAEVLATSCTDGQVSYDATGQRCTCSNRQYRCCRVRKDFMSMRKSERYRFVNTVRKASRRKDYQDFIAIHERLFGSIHGRDQFLPWHRWFLLELENILRKVDKRVTIPYWDWSLYSGSPWGRGPNDVWTSAPWGLGGNGRGRCVNSGPFSRSKFRLTPSAGRSCLRRNFNGFPPDVVAVHKCGRWKASDFRLFEVTLRDDIHDNMHCRIGGSGGTMCTKEAANAPEFFLHHGFTDKIWGDWQKTGPEYRNAHWKGRLNPSLLGTGYRARDLLDLAHQPGGVCVVYDDPRPPYRAIQEHLSKLRLKELDNIPRHKFTVVGPLEFRIFRVGGSERSTAQRIQKNVLEPKKEIPHSTKLNSQDQALGFRLGDLKDATERKRGLVLLDRLDEDDMHHVVRGTVVSFLRTS